MPETTFFRLLVHDDKAAALVAAVDALGSGEANEDVYHVDPNSFRQVPGSPMAYWVGESVRELFRINHSFQGHGRHACVTNPAGNDSRYFRCFWEVPIREKGPAARWVDMVKGGDFSRYYSNVHLVVDWDANEKTFRGYQGTFHRPLKRLASVDYFFKPGLTYSTRSQLGFSVRILPEGCIFHAKGPGVFALKTELPILLGLTNSSMFHQMLLIQMAFGSYEIGVLQRTPIPDLDNPRGNRLGTLALACVELKRDLDCGNETSHVFHIPALLRVAGDSLADRTEAWAHRVAGAGMQVAANQYEIDELSFQLYGIDAVERQKVQESLGRETKMEANDEASDAEEDDDDAGAEELTTDHTSLVTALVSYLTGCALGRFDIRYATGAQPAPVLPDPFAPLPACSPGMLTGADGLPLHAAPAGYPLPLDADGILVDDPDHEDDIVRRMRAVFDVVFGTDAEAIEREACQILGVDELRDYFRRPGKGGFWDDHIKRYSKSRRKAPIYWLLQSQKKNYALWLYYHRLDKDTLFKAQVTYVEPKLRLEHERLTGMQSRRVGLVGRELRQLEREIERQEALISDLEDFRDRLVRAAQRYLAPDLNDGVVLTIAPLWELVPWKEAKQYWDELLAGKYEWSSIGKQLRAKGLVK